MFDAPRDYPSLTANARNGSHGPPPLAGADSIASAVSQTVELFLRRGFGEGCLKPGNPFGVFAKLATYALLLCLAFLAFMEQLEITGRKNGPSSEKEV